MLEPLMLAPLTVPPSTTPLYKVPYIKALLAVNKPLELTVKPVTPSRGFELPNTIESPTLIKSVVSTAGGI